MSDSTVHNLLGLGAVKGYRIVPGYEWPGYAEPNNWTQRAACVPGKAYTLSIVTDVAGEVCFGFYLADGSLVRPKGYEEFDAGQYVVRTLTAPEGAEYVAASWADGNRRPMVVEGTEPAAWAPYSGESLAGGGASMSANLWKAENVISAEALEDGIYACSGARSVRTNVALDRLATNQTFHYGFSVNPGANDMFSMALCYRDAAGNVGYAFSTDTSAPAGKWTRVSGSVVVPSGMTVYQMVICNDGNASGTSGWKVTNPTLSLGSPVTLASSAHTPYATQDHVMVTYATKASLKVTDDSVKAEVTQRTKTDQMVSDLSSKLTQTADGFNASIDRLSDTDKKVNSWFGFGADASGNPQLTMGSSSSPVEGVYTNAGLAYKARSGATLLELDGASRSSTMPHVHADDVSMGSWQWVPTQNGTHFTLQWIGG